MATLLTLAASPALPKSGPFPPPALPGFVGTTSLSATPHGPACPSRASGWEDALPPLGLPVLRAISLCRSMPSPLPRRDRGGRDRRSNPPRRRPSLKYCQVGSRILVFRGLLSVHSRYGLPTR